MYVYSWITEILCGIPPIISNAQFSMPSAYTVGTQVTYSCDGNLRFLDGTTEASLTCSLAGLWEGIDSTCEGETFIFKIVLILHFFNLRKGPAVIFKMTEHICFLGQLWGFVGQFIISPNSQWIVPLTCIYGHISLTQILWTTPHLHIESSYIHFRLWLDIGVFNFQGEGVCQYPATGTLIQYRWTQTVPSPTQSAWLVLWGSGLRIPTNITM